MKDPQRKVTVKRRRRSEPSGERAEAPQRRRPGSRPPGTGAGQPPPTFPSAGMIPGGGRSPLLVIAVLVILCVCGVPLYFLLGSPDLGELTFEAPPATPIEYQMPEPDTPAPPTQPFAPPPTSADGDTWLVMLYQDADDKILEQDIYVDLNEAERAGSSERVQVVSQIDRYRTGFQGDGDWTSARRIYITQDDDLGRVTSQTLEDLGEVNMSSGDTLVDFAVWAIETFPADKYVLILSDHGMGWPGGWSDPSPGGRGDPSIPLTSRLGDELYLMELDGALGEIRSQTGIDQFELIGMDACLMGHIEVFSALTPHARYAVASQEVEPALGWAYTNFLEKLSQYPDIDGAALGKLIVDGYIQEDQRIVDDLARAEFLRQGSPFGGLFGTMGGITAEQLAQQIERDITLTAVDLKAIPQVIEALNQFSFALQSTNQSTVASARTYAQSFTSIFGNQVPASYIDMGSFAQLLAKKSRDAEVSTPANNLLESIQAAIIAEKHGARKPGATGISIYFPNSQLYRSAITGAESYTAIAHRFAQESLWDDFLAYHYAGQPFEPAAGRVSVPEASQATRAPGAGEIQVSSIRLSSDRAAPGRPVVLSADVDGENIGYIYLFVGFYDQASNSILLADADYLESPDTREINGLYYPEWGEGEFTMEFEWEPVLYAISDGQDSVIARFKPGSYGAAPEDAVYTVDGIYTYSGDGEQRYARLIFSDGILRHVFGFTDPDGTGAPREIIPQTGDTFTVIEQWLDLDQSGRVADTATQEGGTLVFGDQMFEWKELIAAPGNYLIGFLVEDLDGNVVERYTEILVE